MSLIMERQTSMIMNEYDRIRQGFQNNIKLLRKEVLYDREKAEVLELHNAEMEEILIDNVRQQVNDLSDKHCPGCPCVGRPYAWPEAPAQPDEKALAERVKAAIGSNFEEVARTSILEYFQAYKAKLVEKDRATAARLAEDERLARQKRAKERLKIEEGAKKAAQELADSLIQKEISTRNERIDLEKDYRQKLQMSYDENLLILNKRIEEMEKLLASERQKNAELSSRPVPVPVAIPPLKKSVSPPKKPKPKSKSPPPRKTVKTKTKVKVPKAKQVVVKTKVKVPKRP